MKRLFSATMLPFLFVFLFCFSGKVEAQITNPTSQTEAALSHKGAIINEFFVGPDTLFADSISAYMWNPYLLGVNLADSNWHQIINTCGLVIVDSMGNMLGSSFCGPWVRVGVGQVVGYIHLFGVSPSYLAPGRYFIRPSIDMSLVPIVAEPLQFKVHTFVPSLGYSQVGSTKVLITQNQDCSQSAAVDYEETGRIGSSFAVQDASTWGAYQFRTFGYHASGGAVSFQMEQSSDSLLLSQTIGTSTYVTSILSSGNTYPYYLGKNQILPSSFYGGSAVFNAQNLQTNQKTFFRFAMFANGDSMYSPIFAKDMTVLPDSGLDSDPTPGPVSQTLCVGDTDHKLADVHYYGTGIIDSIAINISTWWTTTDSVVLDTYLNGIYKRTDTIYPQFGSLYQKTIGSFPVVDSATVTFFLHGLDSLGQVSFVCYSQVHPASGNYSPAFACPYGPSAEYYWMQNDCNPLVVEGLRLEGFAETDANILNGNVVGATTSDHIFLERKIGNGDFETITELSLMSLSYKDEPLTATYRLRVLGINGETAISNEVEFTSDCFRSKMYPNPATEHVMIEVTQPAKVRIFDVLGQLVLEKDLNICTNTISLESLASGIYAVQVIPYIFTEPIPLKKLEKL